MGAAGVFACCNWSETPRELRRREQRVSLINASPTLYMSAAAAVIFAGLYVVDEDDRGDLNIASYILLVAAPAVYALHFLVNESWQSFAVLLLSVALSLLGTRVLLAIARVSLLIPVTLFVALAAGSSGAYVLVERPDLSDLLPSPAELNLVAQTKGTGVATGLDLPESNGASYAAGAVMRFAAASCSGSEARVLFSWRPESGALEQWLDVSSADGGFATGSFVGLGPLTPDSTEYTWTGAAGSQPRFWRINTLTRDGWRPSEMARVTTC